MNKYFLKFLVNPILIAGVICSSGGFLSYGYAKGNEIEKSKEEEADSISLLKNPYLLGPGDLLKISILDAPEEDKLFRILNSGYVTVPFIGEVEVSGLSVQNAKLKIERELNKYLLRPLIELRVEETRELKVSISGEINIPGIYTLKTSLSKNHTIVDAIQRAGGITTMANLKNITIIRRTEGINPSYKKANIDIFSSLINGNQEKNIYLFDGDRIFIPRAESITNDKWTNLSPKSIGVSVIGEVTKPGRIELRPQATLNEAVLSAGGPKTARGSRGKIKLIRFNRNGTISQNNYKLNLSNPSGHKNNPQLENGDIITIYRTPIAIASDTLNLVGDPLFKTYAILKLVDLK